MGLLTYARAQTPDDFIDAASRGAEHADACRRAGSPTPPGGRHAMALTVNVDSYGAVGDTSSVTGTVVAATGSNHVVMPTGAGITAANIGEPIVLSSLGAGGGALATTITGVNGNTITLAATVTTAATSAPVTVTWGHDDSAAIAAAEAAAGPGGVVEFSAGKNYGVTRSIQYPAATSNAAAMPSFVGLGAAGTAQPTITALAPMTSVIQGNADYWTNGDLVGRADGEIEGLTVNANALAAFAVDLPGSLNAGGAMIVGWNDYIANDTFENASSADLAIAAEEAWVHNVTLTNNMALFGNAPPQYNLLSQAADSQFSDITAVNAAVANIADLDWGNNSLDALTASNPNAAPLYNFQIGGGADLLDSTGGGATVAGIDISGTDSRVLGTTITLAQTSTSQAGTSVPAAADVALVGSAGGNAILSNNFAAGAAPSVYQANSGAVASFIADNSGGNGGAADPVSQAVSDAITAAATTAATANATVLASLAASGGGNIVSAAAFGVLGDAETCSTCIETQAGSTKLITPWGTDITAADVGKYIVFGGGGAGGAAMASKIVAVHGGTITLASAAQTTVNGAVLQLSWGTDNAAAIARAVAAAGANGTVMFGAGNFGIASPISETAFQTSLVGLGTGATSITALAAMNSAITINAPSAMTTGISAISGMTVEGSGVAGGDLQLFNAGTIVVDDVTALDATATNVLIGAAGGASAPSLSVFSQVKVDNVATTEPFEASYNILDNASSGVFQDILLSNAATAELRDTGTSPHGNVYLGIHAYSDFTVGGAATVYTPTSFWLNSGATLIGATSDGATSAVYRVDGNGNTIVANRSSWNNNSSDGPLAYPISAANANGLLLGAGVLDNTIIGNAFSAEDIGNSGTLDGPAPAAVIVSVGSLDPSNIVLGNVGATLSSVSMSMPVVSGAGLTSSGAAIVAQGAGTSTLRGSYAVSDPGGTLAPFSGIAQHFYIADGRTVLNAGLLTLSDGTVSLGATPDGGAASAGTLGNLAGGTIALANGGAVTAAAAAIGDMFWNAGTLSVLGQATIATNGFVDSGVIVVSDGTLSISGGATLAADGLEVAASGSLALSQGVFVLTGGTFAPAGPVSVDHGVLDASLVGAIAPGTTIDLSAATLDLAAPMAGSGAAALSAGAGLSGISATAAVGGGVTAITGTGILAVSASGGIGLAGGSGLGLAGGGTLDAAAQSAPSASNLLLHQGTYVFAGSTLAAANGVGVASDATLDLTRVATITPASRIILYGNGTSLTAATAFATLILAQHGTVAANTTIIGSGLITFSSAGALSSSGGALSLDGGATLAADALGAASASYLWLAGGKYTLTGTTLDAADGIGVAPDATLDASGVAGIAAGSRITLYGAAAGVGTLVVSLAGTAATETTIVGRGTVAFSSAGALSSSGGALSLDGGATLAADALGAASASYLWLAGGKYTLTGTTLDAADGIGVAPDATLDASGLAGIAAGSRITLYDSTLVFAPAGATTVTGSGTVAFSSAGALSSSGGALSLDGGATLAADALGAASASYLWLAGGKYTLTGTTLDAADGIGVAPDATLDASGVAGIAAGSRITLYDSTLVFAPAGAPAGATTVTGSGTVAFSSAGALSSSGGALSLDGGATLAADALGAASASYLWLASGKYTLTGTTLDAADGIGVAPDATLDASGVAGIAAGSRITLYDSTLVFAPAGAPGGAPAGATTVTGSGTVAFSSAGALSSNGGALSLDGGATLAADALGAASASYLWLAGGKYTLTGTTLDAADGIGVAPDATLDASGLAGIAAGSRITLYDSTLVFAPAGATGGAATVTGGGLLTFAASGAIGASGSALTFSGGATLDADALGAPLWLTRGSYVLVGTTLTDASAITVDHATVDATQTGAFAASDIFDLVAGTLAVASPSFAASVDFTTGIGDLVVGPHAVLSGIISGLGPNAVIDLTGVAFSGQLGLTAAHAGLGGTEVQISGGGAPLTLLLAEQFSARALHLTADGSGGTFLSA